MEAVIFVATWLFVVSHLDTLVVLVAFCADEEYQHTEVFIGHYVGFGTGLLAAIVATIITAEALQGWTFLLGVIPLLMGLWGLSQRRSETRTETRSASNPSSRISVVAMAGIGLSGENLALFIPFFSGLPTSVLAFVGAIYFVGAGLLFILALFIARHASLSGIPDWVDRLIVPAVLVVVGVYILLTGWLIG